MRTLFGPALAAILALAGVSGARGQTVYVGAAPNGYYRAPAPVYSQNYAFKDEPLMSINRSYLGYSNLTYTGPGSLSPFGATGTGTAVAPAYVSAPAPVRRGFGLFGRRRAYRY
ncbi:MAG: hypothetical protein P4L84_18745 [Isosphaeraceae bacterium]|nr:hypothetical protein [Isosphaeraceae bacterium]